MLAEYARIGWPAVQHDVSTNFRAEPLVDAPTGSAPSTPVPQRLPATDTPAACAKTAPEQGITPAGRRDDALADEHATPQTDGADIPGDDKHIGLMSVAEVLAMALPAGTTGAMEHAVGVAPPPPARSTESPATAAAPHTTTYYTAATSAAAEALEEAQLATGVRPAVPGSGLSPCVLTQFYEDPGSEVAGAGSEGEAADNEWEDGDDDGYAGFAWFRFGHFSTLQAYASGAGLTQPMFVAGVYNGVLGAAAPQPSAIALSPAVWSSSEDGEMSDTDSD